nr:acyltransferase family protein [Kineosphaera limosa]
MDAAPPTGAARGRGQRARRLHALDGLRTIAVVLVLLYHLQVPGFAGGFLGVDVFFVLSGFLITSLLLKEISARGRADLANFWMRRVLRLLPAALLVILTVLLWALFLAPPTQRGSIGLDALWSLLYVANWRFIATSSYFGSDGTLSPLQHLWTLAVEEQFYVLWPLLLVGIGTLAVARFRAPETELQDSADRAERTAARRKAMSMLTFALAGALVLGSVALLAWRFDPEAAERAYMGTDSRAFEPLIGGAAAALMLRPRLRAWVAARSQQLMVLGLVGIALAVPLLGAAHGPVAAYYHGGAALFALSCAVLVAATSLADRRHGLTLLLGSTPVAYLGRISYGVYLWHWPLIVWFIGDRGFEPVRAVAVAGLTIAVAAASYHLVERPIRTGHVRLTPRRVFLQAGVAVGLAVALTSQLGGSPLNRFVPAVAANLEPTPTAGSVVLVGDSVMSRLSPEIATVGLQRGMTVVNAARGGCSALSVVVLSGRDVANEACARDIGTVQTDAITNARPSTVIWWSRYELADRLDAGGNRLVANTPAFWAAQDADLARTVDRLTAGGAHLVVVLVDRVGTGMDSRCTPQECDPLLRRLRDDAALRQAWNDRMHALAATDPRVSVITMDDVYCRDDASPCDDRLPVGAPATADGGVARPDGSHFSPAAMPAVAAALLDRAAAATAHSRGRTAAGS